MLKSALFMFLCSCLLGRLDCTDHEQLTVKRGENAALQCYSPRGADVILLKWRKPDLKAELELYVLFIRENRSYEKHQLPSFKGRVQLRDPEMKDGDLSVIIKNVSMDDAGAYECYAGYGRRGPQLMNSITLKVEEPANEQLTVKCGENAALQCYSSRGADVILLKWRKADQKAELEKPDKERYVLFIRQNRINEKYQLPSFKGRVQLRDPEMKDGDLSVILKNVSMDDAGKYECYAGYMKQEPELRSSITLKVAEPGQLGQQSGGGGNKDEVKEDGGEKSGSVGLSVGLSVLAVLLVGGGVGFMIYRKHRNQSNPDYRPPPDQGLERLPVAS